MHQQRHAAEPVPLHQVAAIDLAAPHAAGRALCRRRRRQPAPGGDRGRAARPARGRLARRRFLGALGAATAAYPQARVDVGETGITLHQARPPVARLVAVG